MPLTTFRGGEEGWPKNTKGWEGLGVYEERVEGALA